MENNVYMGLAVMGSQKNHLQDEKNKLQEKIANIEKQKNAQILDIQQEVDAIDKQMLELDKKMNKSKLVAQKQDEKIAKEKEVAQGGDVKANPTKLTLPVQEDAVAGGDAATTVASLDASSQNSGGAKPGWKFYDKIGSTKKRASTNKKVNEFMDHVWDSYVVENIDITGE